MPTIDMIETGKRIKDMRKKHHMKIQDIMDVCGISANAICKWQKGESIPTIDNLVILAALWGVKIDDILVIQIV